MEYKSCPFCGEVLQDGVCLNNWCVYKGQDISKLIQTRKKEGKPFRFNFEREFGFKQ